MTGRRLTEILESDAGEVLAELELMRIAREDVLDELHRKLTLAPEGSVTTRFLAVEMLLNDIMER